MKRSVFLFFGMLVACGAKTAAPIDPALAASFVWETDEAAALSKAKASGKRLIIDFAASWCAPCTEMDQKTFADPAVRTALGRGYVGLRFDVTAQSEADLALQKRYRADMLPQIILLSADGKELLRIDHFVSPEPFLEKLNSP